MLPPTLYFLVCLNLLVLTGTLLSNDHEVSAVSHVVASVGALLIGKAVLLADMNSFWFRLPGMSARPCSRRAGGMVAPAR